jgi:hypothetical protein
MNTKCAVTLFYICRPKDNNTSSRLEVEIKIDLQY